MDSNAVLSQVPHSLSAKFEGSFAYLTVRDRLPTILTKVIDTIHRNKNNFFEDYGEEGVEAEKRAIHCLSKLRNELQTDKSVIHLEDTEEDVDTWNSYLEYQQRIQGEQSAVSWFKSPWLYVECYMYRRIQEALCLNPPMREFDVFREGKTQSYMDSLPAITTLCTHTHNLRHTLAHRHTCSPDNTHTQDNTLMEHLFTLLQVSLWGNKCDLSISAGQDNSQKASPLDSLAALRAFILLDESAAVWSCLQGSGVGVRVDFILDNAGFELVTDLLLADFLLASGLANEVHFHGKRFPWFVSDVTARDFHWTISQAASSNHAAVSACGHQWQRYLEEGTWLYHDHAFWTLPHEYCDMGRVAPDLYALLSSSHLLIFKGDLNYRKLVSDRDWPTHTPFKTALRGFSPAPLVSLRTLKANVQVGLREGQGEELTKTTPTWMTSGNYAVIQFHTHHA
ncbi:damage-control phosphatase ARMT1 [Engraulis encrasicolus]|uniref:damage-control phosphatase ARMT1 n=1 Tax=Engraulis encrasicolus TaxID=184585 RepID=UPI002FD569E8